MSVENYIDWRRILRTTQEIGPKLWACVSEAGEKRIREKILYCGYYLSYEGIINYPPRIVVRADIDLPEGKHTSHKSVDALMDSVAKKFTVEGFPLELVIFPTHPIIHSLEKDRIFGTQPEIPHGMYYYFSVDRQGFTTK